MRKRNPTTVTSLRRGRRTGPLVRMRGVRLVLGLLTLLCLAVFPLVLGSNVFALDHKHEKPYALIFGTVWGPDSRPAYGIKIRIRRQNEKKARWELTSDHHGEFAQRVPAGTQDYIVWAELKGVNSAAGKPLHAEEVKVHIDSDERADIGVHLSE